MSQKTILLSWPTPSLYHRWGPDAFWEISSAAYHRQPGRDGDGAVLSHRGRPPRDAHQIQRNAHPRSVCAHIAHAACVRGENTTGGSGLCVVLMIHLPHQPCVDWCSFRQEITFKRLLTTTVTFPFVVHALMLTIARMRLVSVCVLCRVPTPVLCEPCQQPQCHSLRSRSELRRRQQDGHLHCVHGRRLWRCKVTGNCLTLVFCRIKWQCLIQTCRPCEKHKSKIVPHVFVLIIFFFIFEGRVYGYSL